MQWLRDQRKAREISAVDVAAELQVRPHTYLSVERGHRPLPPKHYATIARLFSLPVEDVEAAAIYAKAAKVLSKLPADHVLDITRLAA